MSGHRTRPETSRRAVLAAVGTGLASLAGCTAVGVGGDGSDEGPDYDTGQLADLAAMAEPSSPQTFPVAVTPAMVDAHRERARTLVESVPDQPDVPNGVVADRLQHDRQRVLDALAEAPDGSTSGPRRLGDARDVRGDAAAVEGAHRAATGTLDPAAVDERREALRADRLSFEADWEYRGDDPATTLVVHAEVERLVSAARRDAAGWPPVSGDPADDPFQAGDGVGSLERARAALVDAHRLRTRHLDGTDDPRSFRQPFVVVATRLGRLTPWERRRTHAYLDEPAHEVDLGAPFEDTPAVHLYREAQRTAEGLVRSADRARQVGEYATATIRSGRLLAALDAFEATLEAIEAGEFGRPDGVDRVAAARTDAVDALETAWSTAPASVSVAVALPATQAIGHAHFELEELRPADRVVNEAVGLFAFAERYAEAVPPAVARMEDALARTA